MGAPYSTDFRQKALDAVERGERKSHICRMLNISRNTLDLWIKQRDRTGSLAPASWSRGPAPKINDLDAFRAFAEEYGHLTQKEMAEKWPQPVSTYVIGRALRQIGFTRKKKLTATGSVISDG
jgi:transposase